MIVTIEQLQPVLCGLNMGEVVAVAEMEGGSSPVFRVDLATGERLVLKTYTDGLGKAPEAEAFAAAQLRALEVPVTRYLMSDGTKTRLPFRFAVTTYLPGVTADALKDHPGISGVHRDMGALLRKLHSVRMPGYGRIGASGIKKPVGTNAEFLRPIIADAFERFRYFGGDAALAGRLRQIVEDRFDEIVPHSTGPVFAHDDLHPGNILVTQAADGTLTLSGLIDFGNARAADAVFDLAKSLFCSMHQAPDCREPILEGYGAIDHPGPEAALWYYTLLHRMMMWGWLRRIGVIPTAGTPSGLIDDLQAMANI
ncbi:aminoglycoside phosphotransferase family protein [Inquilinus limosus]|uniref:phosphotransferase family protein n=1 Tax=Inquilinus limosus TaxID=171674 RepID=UPI003F1766AE